MLLFPSLPPSHHHRPYHVVHLTPCREDEVARNVAPRHLRKRRLKKGEGDKGTDGAGGEGTGDGKEEEAWVTPDIRLRVFEGLAATGLRSIRYAKELGDGILREVVCNDMDKEVRAVCLQSCAA